MTNTISKREVVDENVEKALSKLAETVIDDVIDSIIY